MNLSVQILDWLFPPRCAFCRCVVENGEIHVCGKCLKKLPYTNNGGMQRKDFVKECVAPFYYEKDVRKSLLRFKFRNTPGYAAAYAPFIADSIRHSLQDKWDVLSWVPVSRRRLRQRGYDQAELICRAVAQELDVEAVPLLRKRRHTKAQSATGSAEKRRANIAGAYELLPDANVAGKRILIIDDIITTGATVSECARTLGSAGTDTVYCATAARARD